MKLYLDDFRKPIEDGWEVVKTSEEFIEFILLNGLPEVISFDHDLRPEHYHKSMYSPDPTIYNSLYESFGPTTGYHCALWLVQYCKSENLKLPKCNIHSKNPVGSNNIFYILSEKALSFGQNPLYLLTKENIPYTHGS